MLQCSTQAGSISNALAIGLLRERCCSFLLAKELGHSILPPRGFRYTDVVRWHSQSPDIFTLAYADSTFPNVLQAGEPYRLDIVARYSGGRLIRGQFRLHMDQYGVPQFHSAVGRGEARNLGALCARLTGHSAEGATGSAHL